jgi:hypothetical protein
MVGPSEYPYISVRERPWQPGEERQPIVRFDDTQPVPETEVEQPVRSYDPPELGEELLGVDNVLIDVVADHDVYRGLSQRYALGVSADE